MLFDGPYIDQLWLSIAFPHLSLSEFHSRDYLCYFIPVALLYIYVERSARLRCRKFKITIS
jgi:hypothetical protein